MAKLGLDYTVVSPSLLENATIHRTSSCFSLGIMEEFTEAYIQSLEQNLDEACKKLHDHDDSINRSSAAPVLPTRKTRPGPSSKFSTLQPHPQASSSLPQEPPAKKSRFSKLSKEELDDLSKPNIPKNTELSTKWVVENFRSRMEGRNECSEENIQRCSWRIWHLTT